MEITTGGALLAMGIGMILVGLILLFFAWFFGMFESKEERDKRRRANEAQIQKEKELMARDAPWDSSYKK